MPICLFHVSQSLFLRDARTQCQGWLILFVDGTQCQGWLILFVDGTQCQGWLILFVDGTDMSTPK
jgi:hypothetical protein